MDATTRKPCECGSNEDCAPVNDLPENAAGGSSSSLTEFDCTDSFNKEAVLLRINAELCQLTELGGTAGVETVNGYLSRAKRHITVRKVERKKVLAKGATENRQDESLHVETLWAKPFSLIPWPGIQIHRSHWKTNNDFTAYLAQNTRMEYL